MIYVPKTLGSKTGYDFLKTVSLIAFFHHNRIISSLAFLFYWFLKLFMLENVAFCWKVVYSMSVKGVIP